MVIDWRILTLEKVVIRVNYSVIFITLAPGAHVIKITAEIYYIA
jgi:hypothetical protein